MVCLLCLLAAFARTVTANPVTIQDASFDSRSLAVAGLTTTLTPWLETGGTSNGNGWFERVNGFAADGQNHLVMNLNHNVWQDLGVTYQDSTRYTLTVAVGNRDSTSTLATNQSRYLLAASDGTVFATGTLNASTVPVGTFIDAPALVFETGESSPASGKTIRILLQAGGGGRSHFDRVRLTALPTNPPIVTTDAASSLTQTGATLNGTVNPLGQTASVSFSYGPTSAYGSTVTATPATISGSTALAVSADLTGLPADSTWHYRVVAETAGGQVVGEDQTFTTTSLATLKDLSLGSIPLSPAFAPATIRYSASVPSATSAIAVTPTTLHAGASATVNGVPVASGTASGPIALAEGPNLVSVAVLAADGVNRLTYTIEVTRGTVVAATFNSATTVPVTAANYQPTGTVNLALNFAPATGTNLTVVNNTGTDLIQGTFDNLAQGQQVDLAFNGILYPFVANYYGGSGNDLVLEWANGRLLAWGYNSESVLGDGTYSPRSLPVPVVADGVLAGKTVTRVSLGERHALALCSDGTLAAWGNGSSGQLGNGSTAKSQVPVAVRQNGVLAGKTVIAISAGQTHSLVLCADGTLASWGSNTSSQLGDSSGSLGTSKTEPVLVDQSGVLAGKTVVAIAAGRWHNLVLCSDGTLASWGSNSSGALGNNSTTTSKVPVVVDRSGVLAGRTVVAISAGSGFNLVACSDGTVAAWGDNGSGQLGDGTTIDRLAPVLLDRSGVLAGRSVTAVDARGSNQFSLYHSVALCSDGSVVTWGFGSSGQLGNGSTNSSLVPLLAARTGELSGKTVITALCGGDSTHALCSDGSMAGWGGNSYGQLGNGSTNNSFAPVAVGGLGAGERFQTAAVGLGSVLARTALPPAALATTLSASGLQDTGAQLNGSVIAQGSTTAVSFEYGLTTRYGSTVAAGPASVSGTSATAVSANLSGLVAGTTYHYRVVATSAGGRVTGENQTFTTSDLAGLAALSLNNGSLAPAFTSARTNYVATVSNATSSVLVTPVVAQAEATVTVNGTTVVSGSASTAVNLAVGNTTISVVVTAAGGATTRSYGITVTRLPASFTFTSASSVPVTAADFSAGDLTANLALSFAPSAGTSLTLVNNTGFEPIRGTFANLAQAQQVNLVHSGISYRFVVDYFGGTGNDLVLRWGNTRLLAWGYNTDGQLGRGNLDVSNVPVAVDMTGALFGKTVTAVAAGWQTSYALSADGRVAAWGNGDDGQLGINSYGERSVPVEVDHEGALFGRQVRLLTSKHAHVLALCTDGALVVWGNNASGQASGNSGKNLVPTALASLGVLADRPLVALAAGRYQSLALAADGTLGGWGGEESWNYSKVPVPLDSMGALAGKTITAVASGWRHSLALCSDGTLAAWGVNERGQLGDGTTTNRPAPVAVNRSGVLSGKTIIALAAGGEFSLVLCSDGTLASWGHGQFSQLGNGSTSQRTLPVLVSRTGVLSGKTVSRISAGDYHSLALCTDGTLAAWGGNEPFGALGNGSFVNSSVPVLVNTNALRSGERYLSVVAGGTHNLALVASPPVSIATTQAVTGMTDTGATLRGTVNANGSSTSVSFQYGLTASYGSTVTAAPATLTGTTATAVSATLGDLVTGTTYHYRVVATSAGGTTYGENQTFTTSKSASLAGLSLNEGVLSPAFSPEVTTYAASVQNTAANVIVTPVAENTTSTITVNGVVVASGNASAPLNLAVGNNTLIVVVTPAGAAFTKTYTVTVTRLPAVASFSSANSVPVTAADFRASGHTIQLGLAFAPTVGTSLTVVRNTGSQPIQGVFDNLAQGQRVSLSFGGIDYPFVADYFGGTGNDLTLQWVNRRLLAWGGNASGQLGDGTTTARQAPVAVDMDGVLAGKVPLRLAGGNSHALLASSDGTLASWGSNADGQLGSSASPANLPVLVDRRGVLAVPWPVTVTAGDSHSLALCSDGTLVAWGLNSGYQLGNNNLYRSTMPLVVNRVGALTGKTPVAVAAGSDHNIVLCSDGTLVGWGTNGSGQLGNGANTDSFQPVAINRSGVLSGKTITAIAAGSNFSLVLCSDGTLATWGRGDTGALGNGGISSSNVPVLVNRSGVLSGKTVTAIACGGFHAMALCSDGTLASWGSNISGQLGNGSSTQSNVPVLVNRSGALSGKTVVGLAAGSDHSLVWCSDGSMAGWGYNFNGQLGNNSATSSSTPVRVNTSSLQAGERIIGAAAGANSSYAIVASPPSDLIPSIADGSSVIGTSQTLAWSREPLASTYRVFFGTDRDAVATATTASPEYLGESPTPAWRGTQPVLAANTLYYWRVDTQFATDMRTGKVWSFRIAPIQTASSVNHVTVRSMAATTLDIPITSAMATAQPWMVSGSSLPSWLTLVTSTGITPQPLQLRFTPGSLAIGTYQTMLRVVSGAAEFDLPVSFRIVEMNITKLITHPNRPVVYAINTSLVGEVFSHVLEIDPATAVIRRTLPIGFAPTDMALDAAAGKLYIANNGYSQSKVIDVDSWAELPPLPLGETANFIEVAVGGRLAVLNSGTYGGVTLRDGATGQSLGFLNVSFNGNIAVPPAGNVLYLARYGLSSSTLNRYVIGATGFTLEKTGPQIDYGSANLILSGDGKRLFWLGRTLDENLNTLASMPSNAEVHATNHTGALAIGESAVWWSDSGTPLATLPFASTVATVSSNDAYLVRFNATTRTLHSTAVASLTDLPGPWPRPGQILNENPQRLSWTPVEGAASYRVFIAADATVLQAMTSPTVTVATAFYDLPTPLVFGQSYTWRVDAVKASGVVAGKVQSFTIRFPQGPQFAQARSSSGAVAVSSALGKLLLGWGDYSSGAQVFDFDAATGSTNAIQNFVMSGYYGDHYFGSSVAVDQGKAVVGAYARDNPADGGGNAFVYRPGTVGYWEQTDILAPPVPVAAESFGKGIAAAGNLMLVGTGNTYSLKGRVAAYLTEPATVQTQVFSASDGAVGDGFGTIIAMDGNRAIISAPGRGSSYNRIPCLYAFTRSTTTGLWSQSQKIAIPGATSSSNAGNALALDGTTMAVRVNSTAVAIFTGNSANQWTHTVSINSSAVTGSSSSFGVSLALHGDQLFIGDSSATYLGTSGGVVFSFRRDGTAWVPGPVITPVAARADFGRGIAVREGWLVVTGDTGNRPAAVFRILEAPNRIPWFTDGVPSQLVVGRAFSIPLTAADADGNAGLTITKLQGPSWLTLADQGNGAGVLSGTPVGALGSTHDAQFEVRDGKGGRSLWATRITLLAPTDLPALVQEPSGADLGVGQEFTLRASASGIGPFQWQWFKDGQAIAGATASTYLISEVGLENAGRYHVRVSNVVGSIESAAVEVNVRAADRYAGDWLTFGGSPAHAGRHPAALYETHFLPAWNTEVQKSYILNRAAISNGRAVVVPQSRFAAGISVKGLDLKTGAALWSFPVPSSNSTNPPSIHQDKVYFQRGKGTSGGDTPQLYGLNAATGQQLWASTFGAQWESYEAPAVGDAGIFINGGTYGGMYGFNFNGTERFFQSLAQYDRWTPTFANGRLFSWVAGVFTEHNPNDGSQLWSLDSGWNWSGWSMNTVSAVAGNSAALISTTELLCVDLPTRAIRWRVPSVHRGSPGIAEGRVFAIQGNAVRSYSLADGTPDVVYQGDAANNTLVDQPILFNDRLAISSETKTWIFNLDDGAMLQTLNAGGRLSYSNGYLLAAGSDGTLRTFIALNYNPKLASLGLGSGDFLPEFDSLTTRYIATVPFDTETVTITPTTQYPDATVMINGVPSPNGSAGAPVPLQVGENEIQVLVTAEDRITTMTYTIVVTRLPRNFVFSSATDIPLTANGFLTGDFPVNILLNYPPVPGTTLTMVDNTGLGFIYGRFSNLAHGQRVWLTYEGVSYAFVANYYGGTGNDLVLQWAGTRVAAWGLNNYGQLGDGGTTQRLSPVAADHSGVLADKTIFAIATGYLHSVALCSDGTLASWGYNVQGQLGDNGSAHQSVPVAVDSSGVLADKVVIALASGSYHNLALCSDGSVAAWGYNNYGQLGDGTKVTARMPVLVNTGGILAGKQVVAVAAGAYQSYALCSDGTLAAWGYNDEGELGNGGKTGSLVPVAVDVSGALAGRKVARIAAGQYHTLALCTDGTLVSWGYNPRGQLGNSSTADSKSPVEIGSFGALAGKSVKAVSAGASHSLALCDDGTLAAWGFNSQSQLGRTGITQSTTPVAVVPPARPLAAIAAGAHHNLLRFTDGGMAAWGGNSNGQLGSNNTQAGAAVTDVDTNALDHGGFIMFAASGCASSHNLAVFAVPVDLPAGLEAWRLENFGDMRADDPLAGDCADCDGDGIPNLVEYAFGFDPRAQCGGKLPVPQRTGDRFELRFSLAPAAPGIEYGAEWSPDLRPGSWRDVPDSGSGDEHLFSLPLDTAPRLFMRLRVRADQAR
jgi:alpha-tubulin suppressor-like RCC1 family protein